MIGDNELCLRICCIRDEPHTLSPYRAIKLLKSNHVSQYLILVSRVSFLSEPTKTFRRSQFLRAHIHQNVLQGVPAIPRVGKPSVVIDG
jgi:hypothetical protein